MSDTFNKAAVLKIDGQVLDYAKYVKDLDGNINTRVMLGNTLKDHYGTVLAAGYLVGVTHDLVLCLETNDGTIRTFHFFNLGSELFHIPLTAIMNLPVGSTAGFGTVKHDPDTNTSSILLIQEEINANEPVGKVLGSLAAIGDSSIAYTIAQDISGPGGSAQFEITDINIIRNIVLVPEGTYDIFVKATGINGTFTTKITIIVGPPGEIQNINLSSFSIEAGSPIGASVGALSIVGGAPPATFLITDDPDNKFDISGNLLITTDTVILGETHEVTILATDQNNKTRPQTFTIEIVASTFVDLWSLDHDGSTEYLFAADNPNLRFTTEMSAIVYLKPAIGAGGNREFLAKWDAFTSNASYAMRVNSSNQFVSLFTANGSAAFITTSGPVPIDAWTSVGMTFKDGVVKHYINGLLVTTNDISANVPVIFSGTAELTIGSRIDGTGARSNYWDGLTDDPAVFNKALTDAQMLAIGTLPADQNAQSSASDMVSWWFNGDNFAPGAEPDEKGSNDLTGFGMNNSNRSTDVPV